MKTVLFVCIHNSGRSQMAQAFFNQIATGRAQGISAGTQPADEINPVVKEAMAELGIDMKDQKPKMLTPELIDQVQQTITMGCGVEQTCPAIFMPTEDWGLEDPANQPIEKVRQIRDQIREKVEQLLGDLDLREVQIAQNSTNSKE